ncbi:MAG: hydrogenase 3 maturation endopeptidase HyCI [Kiloniellales bacterium]|nr:hydrogenase 3 maturation endopeptidase HyCI [Kiloniellales bacterium]
MDVTFLSKLKRLLKDRVVVLGVGNRCRRDDGAGSLLAEQLDGQTGVQAIDAGAVPENYLEKVARSHPGTVLILDAVDFGGTPGDLRILEPELISPSGVSTHGLSLQFTADFLKARTQARLVVLAIQPADIGMGTELSEEVSRAVEQLKDALLSAFHKHLSELQGA